MIHEQEGNLLQRRKPKQTTARQNRERARLDEKLLIDSTPKHAVDPPLGSNSHPCHRVEILLLFHHQTR